MERSIVRIRLYDRHFAFVFVCVWMSEWASEHYLLWHAFDHHCASNQPRKRQQQMIRRRQRPWTWYKNNSVPYDCDYTDQKAKKNTNERNRNEKKTTTKFSVFCRLDGCAANENEGETRNDEDKRTQRMARVNCTTYLSVYMSMGWHLFAAVCSSH